jgi:hypothetical protein
MQYVCRDLSVASEWLQRYNRYGVLYLGLAVKTKLMPARVNREGRTGVRGPLYSVASEKSRYIVPDQDLMEAHMSTSDGKCFAGTTQRSCLSSACSK